MQQLGLPIESLVQQDTQLQSWMTAFANVAPVLTLTQIAKHSAQVNSCTLQIQDYLLTVIRSVDCR